MAQLTSTNVKVFPSAYRGQGIDPEARLNSERNLTAALNALTDADAGFVIDYNSTSKVCTFILGGYWFEANLTGQTLTGSVYAHIKVGDRGTASDDWNCKSLLSFGATPKGELDANNNFTGLVIDSNATYEGATHNLLLLQNGSVPAASKLKIKSSSIADGDVKEPISEHLTAQNIYSDNVQVDTKIIAEEGQFVTGINCEGYANFDQGFTACWDGQGRYLAELNSNGIFYAQGIDLTENGARGHIYASDLYLIDSNIYFEQESRPTLTKTNSKVVIACRDFNPTRDVELTLSDDSGTPTYTFSDNAVITSQGLSSLGLSDNRWNTGWFTNLNADHISLSNTNDPAQQAGSAITMRSFTSSSVNFIDVVGRAVYSITAELPGDIGAITMTMNLPKLSDINSSSILSPTVSINRATGSYTMRFQATKQTSSNKWRITIDDTMHSAAVYPSKFFIVKLCSY